MKNNNGGGFGMEPALVLLCLVCAIYFGFRMMNRPAVVSYDSELKSLQKQITTLKNRATDSEDNLKQLDTKIGNTEHRFAVEVGKKLDVDDLEDLKGLTERLSHRVSALDLENQRARESVKRYVELAKVKIPRLIDVRIKALEKPLLVKLNSMGPQSTKSIESWTRTKKGWHKQIRSVSHPYRPKKKKLSPKQKQMLKDNLKKSKNAMNEAGL